MLAPMARNGAKTSRHRSWRLSYKPRHFPLVASLSGIFEEFFVPKAFHCRFENERWIFWCLCGPPSQCASTEQRRGFISREEGCLMIRASWLRAFARRLESVPSVTRTRKSSRRKLSRSLGFSEGLEDRTLLSATFLVNSTADAPDANPGDGVAAAANGKTTLRAAVMEANAENQSSPVLITLPAGNYKLTIPGAGEDGSATGDL